MVEALSEELSGGGGRREGRKEAEVALLAIVATERVVAVEEVLIGGRVDGVQGVERGHGRRGGN